MKLRRAILAATAIAVAAAAGRSQDGASTLAANLAAAEAVVVATVAGVQAPQPEALAAAFRVDAVVAGAAPAAFALAEPAGACCGRSLFALQPGDVRLVFLRRAGPSWHVVGGPRGLLPALPDVVAHVRALAAATSPEARTRVLAGALAAGEPRLADDAALTLATSATLRLDDVAKAQVRAALQEALDRRAGRAAPLLDVALRCGDPGLRDAALARYLAAGDDQEAALLRQALLRATVPGTVDLALAGAEDERSGLRAAELVAALPPDAAVPAGLAMLRQCANPRVQLRLCQDLLRRGVPDSQLTAAPARVVDAARRLSAKGNPYRVITPEAR